ncbi:uncharacterized protein DDB_G0284459-like [Vespa crabro]|uniref:uncharacterized protein DDB_G0284459-like n=1 Tax=Vespa crabro TaxID=7445 RepID=UPI001F02F23B|nr:uncharacterized protein DDB_G0284459-like [Vespa crabro]
MRIWMLLTTLLIVSILTTEVFGKKVKSDEVESFNSVQEKHRKKRETVNSESKEEISVKEGRDLKGHDKSKKKKKISSFSEPNSLDGLKESQKSHHTTKSKNGHNKNGEVKTDHDKKVRHAKEKYKNKDLNSKNKQHNRRRPRDLEEENKMLKEKKVKEKKTESETEAETEAETKAEIKTENIVREHDSKKLKNQDKKKKRSKMVDINSGEPENPKVEKNKIHSKSKSKIYADNIDPTEEIKSNKKLKLDKKMKKKSQCQHLKNKKVEESNAEDSINADDIEKDKDRTSEKKSRHVDNKINGEIEEFNYKEEEKESTLVSEGKVECEGNENFEEHDCCFNKENVDEEVNVDV